MVGAIDKIFTEVFQCDQCGASGVKDQAVVGLKRKKYVSRFKKYLLKNKL